MAYATHPMAPYHAMDGTQWADYDSDGDRMDFNLRRMAVMQPGAVDNRCDTQTVELALDPELLATFCRRSRRRLRDVQASCQASVKLDRARGVLRVSGPEASIQAVRRQLASLAGPRRNVPPAVWAELMRTRKMCNSVGATVARLQEQSGCRIHIERSQQEVRLFGPGEAVAIADRLLQELARQCKEQAVTLPNDVALSSSSLETLAHRCRITLRMEEGQIVVLGMESAVVDGAEQLRKYLADPSSFEPMTAEEAQALAEQGGASGEEAEKGGIVVWEGADKSAMPHNLPHNSANQLNRPPSAVGRTGSHTGSHKSNHSLHSGKSDHCSRCCPSCGASRFCGSCGALTGFQKGGRGQGWESTTAGGGSDRSKPTTPDSPDTNPMAGGQQWYQFMPQHMMQAGMGQAMSMGQAGMVPVCMVPNGPGGAMMPTGMFMVPASALQDPNGWMAQHGDNASPWVPPQQGGDNASLWVPPQQGGGPRQGSVDVSTLANLHEIVKDSSGVC